MLKLDFKLETSNDLNPNLVLLCSFTLAVLAIAAFVMIKVFI